MNVLDNIRIILSFPSHPGNIGATARVMKNMGLSQLSLVCPSDYPSAEATARASGADDILANAHVVNNLDAALAGAELIVGTSARHRKVSWPLKSARELAPILVDHASSGLVALVFGNEQSGLSNEELSRCHYHLYIDTNPAYASLNLASAVQICCYELRLAANVGHKSAEKGGKQLASAEQQQQMITHLEQSLMEIDFLDPKNPGKLMHRLRRLFSRAQLEVEEVNILRGICNSMVKKR